MDQHNIETIDAREREYYEKMRKSIEHAWQEGANATSAWVFAKQCGIEWDKPTNPYEVKA